jgi:GMP synthase-like glutamine amidotransferase
VTKPIGIFQFALTEEPGFLAEYLSGRGLPWILYRLDLGQPVPDDAQSFSGIAMLGGPMSVNDDLPWIPPLLGLVGEAFSASIPMFGHCLGGQFMAKALGSKITDAPCWEVGWGKADVLDTPLSGDWFGDIRSFDAFHWHGETFEIPAGATNILSTRYCANQAFALGPHLGMQCHMEMTNHLVELWVSTGKDTLARSASIPSIQPMDAILSDIDAKVAALQKVTARLYDRWIDGMALA